MFIQPPVFAPPPSIEDEEEIGLKGRCAFSGHYYDGLTLITRHWSWFNADALGVIRGKYSSPVLAAKFGERAIRKSLQEQLGILKDDALTLGPYPTIIGEIGTPFDMDDKRSYGWTDGGKWKGEYSRQERALDASLNGADGGNAISFTVWTYCPDSSHQWGDGWNMEDLSLWSADDVPNDRARSDVFSGTRRSTKRGRIPEEEEEDVASMYGIGRDDSQAVLLKNNNNSTKVFSAPSALSSLSVSNSTVNYPSETWNDDTILRWRTNPYDFLTEGARAVRAFARPFPVKIVGKVKDIQFDIKSSEFKVCVRVRAEDRPNLEGVNEEEKDTLATEVYIPLVQYAHPRLLSPSRAGGNSRSAVEDTGDRNAPTPASSHDSSESATPTITNATLKWDGFGEQSDVLDIDVTVSDGRWEVHGQTLKWWYDVPLGNESDREYTLQVKRAGGAIKTKSEEEEENKTWVEQLCPDDMQCCVM
ncbi:hypothetical protein D9757_010918 [Collybiopsis confluens]|uniref:Glycoside hydrolase family 5 C-terminal domain-containing protein n=1 Tax=Collybiopsis confluens TaxID=2823264 RepID=A0A8H5GIF5_9AGAR|nr:hypothetical protein D9757_010918 [Collybiopsis confluens]